jgi:hypothetical protein
MSFFIVLGGLFLVFSIFMSTTEGFQAKGSWDKSCKDEVEDTANYLLSADCVTGKQGGKKRKQNTNFNYKNCPQLKVINDKGNLKCEYGG